MADRQQYSAKNVTSIPVHAGVQNGWRHQIRFRQNEGSLRAAILTTICGCCAAKRPSRGINQRLAKVGSTAISDCGHRRASADVMGVPFQTSEDLANLTSIAGACRIEPHPAPRPVEEFTVEERFQTGICRLMALR